MSFDKEKSIMKSRMRIILVVLPLLMATSAFAQNEGKLFKAFDDEKVSDLVESVQKMKDFKNYTYNESSVILFAKELFKQYYKHKDAQVSFTQDTYNALVNHETELESTIKRLRNDSTEMAKNMANMKVGYLKVNEDKTKGLEATITRLRKDSISMATDMANMKVVCLKENETKNKELEETIARLRNDSTTLANANVKLQTEYNAKDSELKAANQSLKDERALTEAFKEAFKDITNAIDEGYKNKALTFTKMDERSLDNAINTFRSTEDFLKKNEVLYGQYEPKVKEMESWKQLKQTLDTAVIYMTKKYNNKKRLDCIYEIDRAFVGKSLTIDQTTEKEEIRKALGDQEFIYANFMDVISLCGKKQALSNEKAINEIKGALDGYEKGAKINKWMSKYHVSYNKAVETLRTALENELHNKPTPGIDITNEKSLKNFLIRLQEIF